jgi:hypothetical protein
MPPARLLTNQGSARKMELLAGNTNICEHICSQTLLRGVGISQAQHPFWGFQISTVILSSPFNVQSPLPYAPTNPLVSP